MSDTALDRVFGRPGGVLAAARGGPGERAVGVLFDVPAGVLLELVLVPTLRALSAHADTVAELGNVNGERLTICSGE